MKWHVLAILFVMGLAGAAELDAIIIDNTPLAGPNCRERGGPNFYEVEVAILNPSTATSMRITYMYYNSSSGEFEDGGKVCDIGVGMRTSCQFKVYTITGGQNKTDTIPFKVTGDFGNTKYEKELEVIINHYPSAYEQNVMEKIKIARDDYNRVIQKYTGCYNLSGLELMQNAYSEIGDAEDKLSICDMQGAQSFSNDAINTIREADRYTRPVSCNVTPPQENNTPPQPPPSNQTNQTENETPPIPNPPLPNATANVTDITSALMKGCMPFAILITLLVIAVWSERKS